MSSYPTDSAGLRGKLNLAETGLWLSLVGQNKSELVVTTQMAVAQQTGTQNGTLASEDMDQHLRTPLFNFEPHPNGLSKLMKLPGEPIDLVCSHRLSLPTPCLSKEPAKRPSDLARVAQNETARARAWRFNHGDASWFAR